MVIRHKIIGMFMFSELRVEPDDYNYSTTRI